MAIEYSCIHVWLFPVAPENVEVSEITCTSAVVSWDDPADNGSITYTIQWRLVGDRRLREWVETVTGQHHFMLTGLQRSSTRTRNYGVQVFRMIEGGLEVDSPEVFFSTNTYGKSSEDSHIISPYM